MTRTPRYVFFGLALLFLIYAVLVGLTQLAWARPWWISKMLWGAVFVAALCAAGGWKLKPSAAVNCLLLFGTLLFLEGVLQVICWLGLLPGLNTKVRCPHGRVYWTREGLGNSVRNAAGWYYPAFNTSARSKIALVGDSMVEAVEIHPSKNQGVLLEKLLRGAGRDVSVLALGNHGTSVAHHRETIDYATRHFQPEEIVMVISMINDISDVLPALNSMPPDAYLYYDLQENGELVLNPASSGPRSILTNELELSHHSPAFTLSATLNSHFMSLQVARSLRDGWKGRPLLQKLAREAAEEKDPLARDLRLSGVNPRCFQDPPDADAEKALTVLCQHIKACKTTCEGRGMRFKLVTVPAFPQVFYATQKGRDWSMRVEHYDFQAPEHRICAFAASLGIPVLELGAYMKGKGLEVREIQQLFLSNGSGHLSEAGHAFCAAAVFETFYRPPAGQP